MERETAITNVKFTWALETFQRKAREHKLYIAVGMAESFKGRLYNSGVLINDQGEVIGITRKSFLWHFDANWFNPGDQYEVFQTPIGKIGIIVCADGRQPEIPRILALKGAQLIIDVTNWVTSGSNPLELSNPQYEYMIPARAVENRVWFVVANKVGLEANSILYCGKSCIISPSGYELAVASSHAEEIIMGEIELDDAVDKKLNDVFDCFRNRLPAAYGTIIEETDKHPIHKIISQPIPCSTSLYASAVQFNHADSLEDYFRKSELFVKRLVWQYSSLIVFPELPCTADKRNYGQIINHIRSLAVRYKSSLVTSAAKEEGSRTYRVSIICSPEGVQGEYRKKHLTEQEKNTFTPGDNDFLVANMSFGRVGFMLGYEGLIPEVARILMLKGADLIVWQTDFQIDFHRIFARTRAAENRVFLIVANTSGKERCGLSLITNPDGALLASAFSYNEQATSAQLNLGCARYKDVVSGSNIVWNRKPKSYGPILEVGEPDDH